MYMKKLFCMLPAIAFFLVASAQETHFGVKAGLNLASVEVEGDDDLDSKAGLHVGGLAHIHLSRHFAIQPELVFSMQGGKAEDNDDVKLKLNYINVPFLVQYMVENGLRLQTGPQLGFLVGAESKVGDLEVDIEDNYSTIDFSWTFGAGYLFPSGFGIDARYNHGISNASDISGVEVKNRVFQFGLFYQFMHNNAARRR